MKAVFVVSLIYFFGMFHLAGADEEKDQRWLKVQMERALGSFAQAIETAYAPFEWKQQLWGWDLEAQITQACQAIARQAAPTVQDFRYLLRDLFASGKDHHLAVFFYATERADLPFQIRKASGVYCISSIDRYSLPKHSFPIALGDELVSVNQEPIASAVDRLSAELGLLPDLTGQRLSEAFFSARQAALGHPIPKGEVKLSIRRQADGKILDFSIPWIHTPESVVMPELKQKMCRGIQDFLQDRESTMHQKKIWSMASRYTYTPELGKILWQTDSSWAFHAYLFETDQGHKYGYLRIPYFSFPDMHLKQLEQLVAYFESETEGLVIDIANNPGGYLLTVYACLSMLTDRPLTPPRHAIKLYPKEINRAAKGLAQLTEAVTLEEIQSVMGETNDGYPVTVTWAAQLKRYFAFLLEQWSLGKRLTEPCYYLGIDQIDPHPTVRYTGPIVLLTNALCFSGADFFAAILKDNQRARLLGEVTAGAGGVMLEVSYPNLFGVQSFHLTTTLAERNNGQYIENKGVKPDIVYSLTREDLTRSRAPYAVEILTELSN